MPIPRTRAELLDQVQGSYKKLSDELDAAGPRAGGLPCVDGWTVKDLLAVRLWWTERVVEWIAAGQRGESPVTPAAGYQWRETPRLNNDIAKKSRRESFRSIKHRLAVGYQRVIQTIEGLNDRELLDSGHFEWAGDFPISRWISINTARQYVTARTYLRRALKNAAVERRK